MIKFPSPVDREVASSLLLLSSQPSFISSSSSYGSESEFKFVSAIETSFVSTETRSCESAISNNRKRSDADFMDFKIAKKRRTNVTWYSVDTKSCDFDDNLSKCSNESKEESCLSTGSSTQCTQYREVKKTERYRSSSIRRRAVKILEFLSNGCYSEVKIRQVLGDSADTSKALRMLLKMGNVKRSGAGGKHEPYVYKIA